jgi:rare lipoprotein A
MRQFFSDGSWRQIALSGPLFMLLGFLVLFFNGGTRPVTPVQARADASAPTEVKNAGEESGTASYYGFKYQGRPTASGEIFDLNQFTAAHKTLPFGTRVKVTNLANDRSVIVRINDRGPFVKGRVIDLSEAAAHELEMIQSGTAEVKIEVLR